MINDSGVAIAAGSSPLIQLDEEGRMPLFVNAIAAAALGLRDGEVRYGARIVVVPLGDGPTLDAQIEERLC